MKVFLLTPNARPRSRKAGAVLAAVLVQVAALLAISWGLTQMARGTYVHAKAKLAQVLIRRAWVKASSAGGPPKPWPWADTTPVARLGAPLQRIDLMVLDGASGRTLAFGPGNVAGTARPGRPGNAVIGGHRDTHFRFLKDLKNGDPLLVESPEGAIVEYTVTTMRVVDHRDAEVMRDFGDDRLTLITCYPFDAIEPGGPQRYVVVAVRTLSANSRKVTGVRARPPVSAHQTAGLRRG